MPHIVYQGGAHIRELSAADLKKLGAKEGKKVTARRGEPLEVDAKIAKVLLEHDQLAGEFAEYDEKKHGPLAKAPLTDGVGGGGENTSGGSGTNSTPGGTTGGGSSI